MTEKEQDERKRVEEDLKQEDLELGDHVAKAVVGGNAGNAGNAGGGGNAGNAGNAGGGRRPV